MSKLRCPCGHVISDTTDNLPFKGEVTRDQDTDALWGRPAKELASFVAAVRDGKREAWIASHFGPEYPRDLNDASVIGDFFSGLRCAYTLDIYECLSCGRLLVQRSTKDNTFVAYAPESGRVEGLLAAENASGGSPTADGAGAVAFQPIKDPGADVP